YVFDYGAPVGFRLALKYPDRVTAIISQNGNAYQEGLSEGWNPIQKYWKEPNEANRTALREFLKPEATKWQYSHGVQDTTLLAPEAYELDSALLARPGNDEIQLDLFLDYASNVALYPKFQEYFRTKRPPTLAVWGNNDPFFLPPGAESFRRDNPNAQVQFFNTGHFALETQSQEIGSAIKEFLENTVATARAKSQQQKIEREDANEKQADTTAVLVPAAWADGSSWNKVTTRLEAEGFRVVSTQIPLTSFSDDVAALKRVLRRQSGRVVLVGHSYGGYATPPPPTRQT